MGVCSSHITMLGHIHGSRFSESLRGSWRALAATSIVSISYRRLQSVLIRKYIYID